MAAKQMKKVTGHLVCPICYELYKKPKYLSCYHSYCEECLVKLVMQSNITCPECKKTSVVPSGGVEKLPNNFFINRLLDEVALKRKVEGEEEAKCDQCVREDPAEVLCLDCGIFLCNYCYGHHKYSKEYQGHNMMALDELQSKKEKIAIKPKAKYVMCQKHELELNFYCETCDQLVCQYCIVKDHLKHDHDTVKVMAVKHRKELDKIMEPVRKMIDRLSIACKKVSNMRDKIGAQADDIDKEIDRYYDELHRRLQLQRDELKKELHEATKLKKKEVALQLKQMEHTQAQLESIKELNGAMKDGSGQETLLMKKQVVDDVKRVSDSYNTLDTQPIQSATMEFVSVEKYKKSLPQFGHLCDVCPRNCEAVDIPKMAVKGERVSLKVITKDHSGQFCKKGGSQVIILVQSCGGDVTPVEVKDNEDGSYSGSFVANQVGEVKLSVTIKGQQIKGSPFIVKVQRNCTKIDKPSKVVNEVGRLGEPWSIAFGRDGTWAVTDDTNHCVWIFDKKDQLVTKFGSKGTGNGQFNRPLGVAFDAHNHLYVTDYKNNWVQKFETDGKFLLSFHTLGFGNAHLDLPLGITAHNDKVYVTEHRSDNQCISVFHLDGQFSHIIGSGYLKYPHYIAVNAKDQLLVAEYYHSSIFMFTLDGNYVGKFGTQGTGRGQLSNPSGIGIDQCGFILVSEGKSNRVSIFDQNGTFIHCFGLRGSEHGQFSQPRQIAISPSGDIYICDRGNRRIQIFSP